MTRCWFSFALFHGTGRFCLLQIVKHTYVISQTDKLITISSFKSLPTVKPRWVTGEKESGDGFLESATRRMKTERVNFSIQSRKTSTQSWKSWNKLARYTTRGHSMKSRVCNDFQGIFIYIRRRWLKSVEIIENSYYRPSSEQKDDLQQKEGPSAE